MSGVPMYPRDEERPALPPIGRALASVLKLVALSALGLYALLLLTTLAQNPSGFYDAEVSALQSMVSGVVPTEPGAGPAGPGVGVGIATTVVCIAVILFLWLLVSTWFVTMGRQMRELVRCRWVGFWGWLGCLWQTIVFIVEFVVFILIVVLALIWVVTNILATVTVIGRVITA